MSSFDRVAKVYDATRSLDPNVMTKIVSGVHEFLSDSSLVDFGVGTGRFAAPLLGLGHEVVGIDISQQMMQQAKEKGVTGLIIASAEAAPIRSESFDYAMVVHFMHLLQNWRTAMKEISRIVRKGLVTVVEDIQGSHTRDMYVHLREERGFPMRGLKLGERDLVKMVEPSLVRTLVEYREEFDPSPLMDEYAAKLHSITWDVPDEVNMEIVGKMRSRLGEKRELKRSAALVVWDRERLKRFDLST